MPVCAQGFSRTPLQAPLNAGERDQSHKSRSHDDDGGGDTTEPPRTPNNKPDCLRYMHSIISVLSKNTGYPNSVATQSPVVNYPINMAELLKQFNILKASLSTRLKT